MTAFFITGTDTDAGKTTVTAGLLRAFRLCGTPAYAIKPVQTGCIPSEQGTMLEAPDVRCWQKAGGQGEALQMFRVPCSPHLAAGLENSILSVKELAKKCCQTIRTEGVTLLEGAGGIYVPLNDHETMLDLMKALRLPVLLVVGNRLGCINHALLSLDALIFSGLDVVGMVLCRTTPDSLSDAGTEVAAEKYILEDNERRLREEGKKRGIPLLGCIPYIEGYGQTAESWDTIAGHLVSTVRSMLSYSGKFTMSAEETLSFDREHLWHPYTSALNPLPVREIVGCAGARLTLRNDKELVDGMSSWWCKVHGYGNTRLVRTIQEQAAKFSHIMFGGLTHQPAVELGKRLLKILPSDLKHIFYADSGSVAVEVAMKMAVQFWQAQGHGEKHRFAALRGAYHGDTLGAMSLCDPVTGMHSLFRGVVAEQLFVERPRCRFDEPYKQESFFPMEQALRSHAHELAAVVVEPVVQGAGGMWFYHPDYLRDLRNLCNELDILLIADEIATGFGRTGRMFACNWAGISPDILCIGKSLTGGMMTFSAVAVNDRVTMGISSADASRGSGVFMHGPTFMGNPLACAVACASLDELQAFPWQERVQRIEKQLAQELDACRDVPGVADVRVLGAIGVVEMEFPINVEVWQDFFVSQGVWIRPFGRTVYIMPPFIATDEEISMLSRAVNRAVLSASAHEGCPVQDCFEVQDKSC
jgi:adenosylmethionine-8-amino-7-oxononanoate aminotransferase